MARVSARSLLCTVVLCCAMGLLSTIVLVHRLHLEYGGLGHAESNLRAGASRLLEDETTVTTTTGNTSTTTNTTITTTTTWTTTTTNATTTTATAMPSSTSSSSTNTTLTTTVTTVTTMTMAIQAATTTTSPLTPGMKVLQVESNDNFVIGRLVVIDQGTDVEEENEISLFGSIILKNPLKFAHPAGITVTMLATTTLTTTTTTLQACALPWGVDFQSSTICYRHWTTDPIPHGGSCLPRCVAGMASRVAGDPTIPSLLCDDVDGTGVPRWNPETFTCVETNGCWAPAPATVANSNSTAVCVEGNATTVIKSGSNCTLQCARYYMPNQSALECYDGKFTSGFECVVQWDVPDLLTTTIAADTKQIGPLDDNGNIIGAILGLLFAASACGLCYHVITYRKGKAFRPVPGKERNQLVGFLSNAAPTRAAPSSIGKAAGKIATGGTARGMSPAGESPGRAPPPSPGSPIKVPQRKRGGRI